MMSTCGFSIARSIRSVICCRSWLNAECTEATTMSSAARQSSARSMRAVGPDVALDAGEQPDAVPGRRPRESAPRARARALVEAVGHRQRLAVIGDRDVLEPGVARRLRHRPRRRPCRRFRSCACAGRHADRASSIRRGSACASRRLDLAAVLAQLRRHPRRGRAPRRCPPRVAPATRSSSAMRNSPYSFSLKPEPDRAVAQRDVVRLRAGEVLHRRAAAVGGDEAQVRLEAAAQSRTLDLVSPCPSTRSTSGVARRSVHQRCGRRRRRECR